MLTATCDQCGTAGQFPPFLAGQRVKCKACQQGWVQLPPPDFVPLPKPPPFNPPPAEPPPNVRPQARRPADAPPPEWQRKHADLSTDPNDPVQPDPPGGRAASGESGEYVSGTRWLRNVGGTFLVLGVGSSILHFTNIQFRVLMCLEPLQPGAGLVMACIGAAMLLLLAFPRR